MEECKVPTEEIKIDIKETQIEIDEYQEELKPLLKNPQRNRKEIYFLEGRISKRENFIKKLNKILEDRDSINANN